MFKNQRGWGLLDMMLLIIVYLILWIPVTFWTDCNLGFWFSYFKKTTVNIPFLLSYLVSVICNGFILIANILMSLLRFAV